MHKKFIAGLLLLLPAVSANAEPKYKWRLTTFVPESNQVFIDYVKPFIDRVHLLTDGEIEIKAFGPGVIAGPFEGYQAVQKKTADLAFVFPAHIVNQHPANAVFGGIPAGLSGEALFGWLFEGGGERLWIDFRRQMQGLQPIIAGVGPTEIFAHARKPIRTAEDLKGLKFRTAGAWATILQEFGASPVVLPPAEVFTALERGTIDAAEFATPDANRLAGYQNIARYIVVPGVHTTSFAYEVVLRADLWDSLPSSLKEKLRLAGKLTAFEGYIHSANQDVAAFRAFKNGKNEIVELDPAFLKQVAKATDRWVEKQSNEREAKGDTWLKRIYASFSEYKKNWSEASIYRWIDN
jgi:TRAP-type mannitol/chloroaromatic compound transport system substrate-binding protein